MTTMTGTVKTIYLTARGRLLAIELNDVAPETSTWARHGFIVKSDDETLKVGSTVEIAINPDPMKAMLVPSHALSEPTEARDDVIERLAETIHSLPNAIAKMQEVMYDLTWNMASRVDGLKAHEDLVADSRERFAVLTKWTLEFMQHHKKTDWSTTDYILTVDAFYDEKVAALK